MKLRNLTFVLLSAPIILASCAKDKALSQEDAECATVDYASEIQPILDMNCAVTGCHNTASSANGFDFSTSGDVVNEALNGVLMESVDWSGGASNMPQGGPKLSQDDIDKIRCWIEAGAQL